MGVKCEFEVRQSTDPDKGNGIRVKCEYEVRQKRVFNKGRGEM